MVVATAVAAGDDFFGLALDLKPFLITDEPKSMTWSMDVTASLKPLPTRSTAWDAPSTIAFDVWPTAPAAVPTPCSVRARKKSGAAIMTVETACVISLLLKVWAIASLKIIRNLQAMHD